MIVDKSAIRPTDVILEIGPGTGKNINYNKVIWLNYYFKERNK